MSAVELLAQVKVLPARERRKFLAALQTLEDADRAPRTRRSKSVEWPDVEARARRISGGRVLPNLVLLARAESGYSGWETFFPSTGASGL